MEGCSTCIRLRLAAWVQGIVGGTYDRYLEGESAVSKPESQLYIPQDVSKPASPPWSHHVMPRIMLHIGAALALFPRPKLTQWRAAAAGRLPRPLRPGGVRDEGLLGHRLPGQGWRPLSWAPCPCFPAHCMQGHRIDELIATALYQGGPES